MSRIPTVPPSTAEGKVKQVFDVFQSKLGLVPNLVQTFANSPAALEGYAQFSGALSRGHLPARTREQISLAVSQANECEYCLAAHALIGKMVGLSASQIHDSRLGTATDPAQDVLLRFARKVNEQRGQVSDTDVAELRHAGFSDGDVVEVVANVALNVLTNYLNLVAQTELDFPSAPELAATGNSHQPATAS